MVLLANGVSAQGTAVMLSAFSSGMLIGRFLVGFALDRLPSHIVATVGMGLPAIGLLILASNAEGAAILTLASFFVGFSFGADGDIAGYFVARYFGVAIYSSAMGLITMAFTLSIAIGAALLSVSLKATGGYDTFLSAGAVAVLAGASLFLLLGRQSRPVVAQALAEPQATLH
jgi:predicted MFS family arabinose efflux permease